MSVDTREEIAADIRAWLEWQAFCGTDVWRVDDISIWDSCAQSTRSNPVSVAKSSLISSQNTVAPKKLVPNFLSQQSQTTQKPIPPPKKTIPPPLAIEKPIQPPAKDKLFHELPKWWQSIVDRDKPEKFDVSQVPHGGDGVQRAFAFRDKHCLSKSCKWGVGRADAPVVLIEGHRKNLVGDGLKMLGDMRVHVLQLAKNHLYWIPKKRELGCGHCDSMALAQLNAIQPKAILILGFEPLDMLSVDDRSAAEEGAEFFVQLNNTSVPAICTHHPMTLLEEAHKKGKAKKDLLRFRAILDRLQIPRSN